MAGSNPNHTALSQGVKLYTDAMRGVVKQRLAAHYNNTWWEAGVMRMLSAGQRQNVEANLATAPGKDKIDLLDPQHIEKIVLKNFDSAFKGVFSDYEQTQSWLKSASTARNVGAAHSASGDLPADDVGAHLLSMVRLLEQAGAPEAGEIEQLRQSVLKIGDDSGERGERPAATVGPAPQGALPYWWQYAEPQDAFKNPGSIDESLFAATLGGVFSRTARREYLDPRLFFAHTYFTQNLRQTIHDVASRLNAGPGPSVTEMQTPFGGGKTHAMVALYHLVNDPKTSLAVPGVREALGAISIPAGSRALVFDGQEYGAEPIEKEDGTTVNTLWGELAYQADRDIFQDIVKPTDSRGEAPGNAIYRKVLEAASPCLILIDELVSYLVKLRYSSSRKTQNLYRQTNQFIQEMLQEAGNVPGVCVILSLPKSRTEFGGLDPVELQTQLGILDELQARADRVVAKRTPVNDDEIYTLMSKRLFKNVDQGVARQVAAAYREMYERDRELYDAGVFSPDYLDQQVAAYPLHPALIDILYKKWSTATDFPRTRAVLQLLANVVADQWTNRTEAHTIQPAQVNLERERIRTRIISAAGDANFDGVVAADIIGGDAHADMEDIRRGDVYLRFHVARGVATTLLMSSFGGRGRQGAFPQDLYLGSVAPNLEPSYVREVIDSLEQTLWYVHSEGEMLRFQVKVNIYRAIGQEASGQPDTRVNDGLRRVVGEVIGRADGFKVLEWPAEDSLADVAELSIAVLSPKLAVTGEGSRPGAGRERIDRIWERSGGGLREYRNALIFVAPDRDAWERTDGLMREVLAYEWAIDTGSKKNNQIEVGEAELKRLKAEKKDKEESLRASVTGAYRWILYPDGEPSHLEPVPLPQSAAKDDRIANRVMTRLADQNYGSPKILEQMSAIYFASKIAPQLWRDEDSPLDVLNGVIRRLPQWTYLPMLPKRDETLRRCIREGIEQGLWAVAIGDGESQHWTTLIESGMELDGLTTISDGLTWLVKGAYRDLVREELRVPDGANDGRGTYDPGDTGARSGDDDGGPSVDETGPAVETPGPSTGTDRVIARPKRHGRVRLTLDQLPITKTSNLQPYLFKFVQTDDPFAKVTITIEVESGPGIDEETIERKIVEGFSQLGIAVRWEAE